MPLLVNTLTPTEKTTPQFKKQAAKVVTFDYEFIEELVDQFNEEYYGKFEARMQCVGESLCLHIWSQEDNRVIVYHAKNCADLYTAVETNYVSRILSSDFMNSDLDDKWEAFLMTIDCCKIMDDTLEFS